MDAQIDQQMKQGVEQYYQPKQEGDIDLVASVRLDLVEAGLLPKVTTSYDTNRFIVEAQGKPSHVQRFLLNRYWSMQLMSSNKPSVEERYCLIPNGEVVDWLRLFRQKVLPFIIANELPVVI